MDKIEVIRYSNGEKIVTQDKVAKEHNIKLFVNRKVEFLFQSYPLDINELITGFLFSEKYISTLSDLKSYTFDEATNECHVRISKSFINPKHTSPNDLVNSSSSPNLQPEIIMIIVNIDKKIK